MSTQRCFLKIIVSFILSTLEAPERINTLYKAHGFGSNRFLNDEYIATFRSAFRQDDSLYLLPIYYAGGTAQKDISSDDIVQGRGPVAFTAQAICSRDALLSRLKSDAKPEDCVLIMGARDPSLPALVIKVVEMFGGEKGAS